MGFVTSPASALIWASSLIAASARSARLNALSAAMAGTDSSRTSAAAKAARTNARMGGPPFPSGWGSRTGRQDQRQNVSRSWPSRATLRRTGGRAQGPDGVRKRLTCRSFFITRRGLKFLLHRLVAADDPFRSKPPVIAQRIRPPHLRPLRPILVPGPRVEIAERLVLHEVHLAEELDPNLIRVALIDRDVVADDVAAGSPNQMNVVLGKPFAGALDLRPILDLERDVMKLRNFIHHEIDGVVIGAAAQKREGVIAPVRHAKAEHVGVELHHLLHVLDAIGHVSELERHDAELAQVLLGEDIVGENFDPGVPRILEDNGLGDARRDAAAPLALDSVLRQLARKRGKIAPRRNLEREPRQRVGRAGLERDRLQSLLAREKGALAVAFDQGQADDGGIVCDLPIEIGGRQRGMAEPAHLDHRFPPDRRHRRARAKIVPSDGMQGVLARMLALMVMRNYASFAPSGKTIRKNACASRAPAHAADRRAVWQKPAFAALADEGDLGVKASPSRPRSSVG